jgi:hypothetical protein
MATTSGSAGFNLDLTELVEEAFERAGSELRTGYDLKTARRSLNLLFADWANRGINMWTFEQGTITLTQGLNTYAVPTDTVDLLDHVIRTQPNVASTQSDLTITRISVSTYATLPNKLNPSQTNSGLVSAFGRADHAYNSGFVYQHQCYRRHNRFVQCSWASCYWVH